METIKEFEDRIAQLEKDRTKTKNPATIAKIQSEISVCRQKIRDLKSIPAKKKEAVVQKDNAVVADHTDVKDPKSAGVMQNGDKFVMTI